MKNTIVSTLVVICLLAVNQWPEQQSLQYLSDFTAYLCLVLTFAGLVAYPLAMIFDKSIITKPYPDLPTLWWAECRWFVIAGALVFSGHPVIAALYAFAALLIGFIVADTLKSSR